MHVVGGDRQRMLDEQAAAKRLPHRSQRRDDGCKAHGDHGELDRCLPHLARKRAYNPLMPSAMACNFAA